MKKKKICFVSSSGGHWEELMCLQEIAKENICFYVTEEGGQSEDCKLSDVYLFKQINRKEKKFFLHFVRIFIEALRIVIVEKPDVVITTGALISFPFCVIAKLLGKKVIYIESFARVNDSSLTGKLVKPFADLYIVQWKSMIEKYPKAIYGGGIF